VVGEVTRGVTARDEYERVARDIRYGFYGEVRGLFMYVHVCIYICTYRSVFIYICLCEQSLLVPLTSTFPPPLLPPSSKIKTTHTQNPSLLPPPPPPKKKTTKTPNPKQATAEFGCPAILLGHHQGDVEENVLSNAMRGVGPLHLSGMGEVRERGGKERGSVSLLHYTHTFTHPHMHPHIHTHAYTHTTDQRGERREHPPTPPLP
jgi:hypothetical protein